MADFSGRKIAVGIGKETTRGTIVAPTYFIPHLDIDFVDEVDKVMNDSALGILDKFNSSEVVKGWAEGTLEAKVGINSFGLILASAFGQAPSSAANADVSGTVKDHTYAMNNSNTALSLTLAHKTGVDAKRYPMAVLRSLEINVEVGEFVTYSAEFVSKQGVTSTETVAYSLENEFKAKYAVAKMASATGGLAGATAIPLRSMRINISREVDPWYAFGSDDPNEIFNRELEVGGDMTLRYTDATYRDLWKNDTPQALRLDLINTDVTIGTAARPSIQLTLPKVTLDAWDIDQAKESMVEQTIGFKGLYDTSSASTISAIVTNTVASY